jgi:hypothetical protein
MSYLKDINILGYVDAKGDIAKVSKIPFTNQVVKNLLNLKGGDSRLSDQYSSASLDDYKFQSNSPKLMFTNTNLTSRVRNALKQITNIKLKPTQGLTSVTFDVSYEILDSVSKNLQTSSFKFTIDK